MDKARKNPWIVSTVILAVVALALIILNYGNLGIGSGELSAESAGEKLVSFLNTRTGGGVEYVSAEDLGSLYQVTVSFEGNQIPVFVTVGNTIYPVGSGDMDNNGRGDLIWVHESDDKITTNSGQAFIAFSKKFIVSEQEILFSMSDETTAGFFIKNVWRRFYWKYIVITPDIERTIGQTSQ